MQKYSGNSIILIALYEKKEERPVEDKVYMFSIDNFFTYLKNNLIPESREYASFPISETLEGFELLRKIDEN
ncbi:hypothetical protein GNY06_02490 [Elizabethkingia argentiflava]|uniref:Uncharacterized protein n=1 Tax=Elizabethkingia argenteiflava TaxID=2681556 RepID=A0A845PTD8_9FLAO|nr:hypothetical protein [Elizabethkingia argenteiflava]NAW50301.1 hypothetical protein [Elizabethkingia argenteiflava]